MECVESTVFEGNVSDCLEKNEKQTLTLTSSVATEHQWDIISDVVLDLFTLINYVILAGTISIFGVIFNVVNMMVFVRQGFQDPINISLFGLAIADTGALLTMVWMSLCYNPEVIQTYRHLDFQSVQNLTAGWPHVCFSRISNWITALITLERLLCMALPFKVKTILSPKRTTIIVIAIFILMISNLLPIYLSVSLKPTFSEARNRTVIALVYSKDGSELENVSSSFSIFAQFISFAVVTLCTGLLVKKLKTSAKWRKSASSSLDNKTVSTRDRKVVNMVILISLLFIASYIPVVFGFIAMLAFENYSVVGQYKNLFLLSWTFFFTLESINSATNIFIYLNMSSKFRETLLNMLKIRWSTK